MVPPELRRALQAFPAAPGLVIRAATGRALRRIAPRALDTTTGPSIGARAAIDTDPRATIATLLPRLAADRVDALNGEYDAIDADLVERARVRDLPMPAVWRTERGTGLVLYTLVRELRPEIVVETGVANGWSTVILLRALDANGTGALHSFDVRRDIGGLVDDADGREHWVPHVLEPRGPRGGLRGFTSIIETLPPIGVFFHDSDHSYLHMRRELRAAGRRLAPGGALCSDDVAASHAFVEACEALAIEPRLLVDGRKASGYALR